MWANEYGALKKQNRKRQKMRMKQKMEKEQRGNSRYKKHLSRIRPEMICSK